MTAPPPRPDARGSREPDLREVRPRDPGRGRSAPPGGRPRRHRPAARQGADDRPRARRRADRPRVSVPGTRPLGRLPNLRRLGRRARRRGHHRRRHGRRAGGHGRGQRRHGQGRRLLPDDHQENPPRPGNRRAEPLAAGLPRRLLGRLPADAGRGLSRRRRLRPGLPQQRRALGPGRPATRRDHGQLRRRRAPTSRSSATPS